LEDHKKGIIIKATHLPAQLSVELAADVASVAAASVAADMARRADAVNGGTVLPSGRSLVRAVTAAAGSSIIQQRQRRR
jgi:hypothetical protein